MGIVVPFSWSFWGAVVEHAELQAAALRELGHDVRLVMGNDPPGQFTRALHPRVGRHGDPPPEVIPIGRSVIVPANGSLPNIILSPRSIFRIKRVLAREGFDVLHLHEPMTPTPCIAALALFDGPMVGTHHASGELGWMRLATPVWGFLEERLDRRIAVSEQARASAQRWLPGDYEIVPNGVLIPEGVEPGGREHRVVFAGRQEPRKGLQILLRAWPEIRRRTGARLRIAGADPLAVRLLLTRLRVSDDGIDVLGFLTQESLTAELASAKALIAPSLGGESFGMVLTRAFACATPVVASDIPGYRDVMTPETSVAVAPGDPAALADAVDALLADEAGRVALGAAARQLAIDHYSWQDIARRLVRIYDGRARRHARAGGRMNVLPRSRWLRAALGVPVLASVAALLWWRGPDWNVVYHAFDLVNWAWVAFALGLNLVSVFLRSLAWKLTIDQALDPPEPRFSQVFSAFSVGLLGNAVLPGRIGELARVAVLRRHLPRGVGASGTLVGTVFAHRLFDLPAALLLILYVALTAKVPHWAVTSLVIVSIMGAVLFTVAFVTARRHHRPIDGARSLRQLLSMARQGLAVLRSPWPAFGAIVLQCAGWFMQLLAVYVAMRAFDLHPSMAAAGLVLLLMNVATIFPLWPGNIGLLQAAVALPLVQYGVPYSVGFAYALVLQVIEMSVGVGVGLIFLAREGLSFASLRDMPEESETAMDEEGETHPPERRRARARVPG